MFSCPISSLGLLGFADHARQFLRFVVCLRPQDGRARDREGWDRPNDAVWEARIQQPIKRGFRPFADDPAFPGVRLSKAGVTNSQPILRCRHVERRDPTYSARPGSW